MLFPRFLAAAVLLLVGVASAPAAPLLAPRIDGAALFSLDASVENIGGDFFFAAGLIDVFDDGAGGALTPPSDFTIAGFLADVGSGGVELNVFANPGDVDAVLFGRSVSISATPGVIEIGFEVVSDATGRFGGFAQALLLEGLDMFADSPLSADFSAAGASAQITAAAVVPVPLTAPLLLAALGAILVAARRR